MKDYIHAARLRTLPLSVSGIIVGAFLAKWQLNTKNLAWDWQIFALAILVTLLYQILSNFANDYGDGIKGTDNQRTHKAEARAVASGKITAKNMRLAMITTAIASLLATILLLYIAFFPRYIDSFVTFIALGIACILAAIGYTVGKKPYGYLGLGDIMVFLFFGWVSVGGSYYLFTKHWQWDILLPASAIGMLSAAVLNLNNMRDIESDAISGKKSLALRLGFKNAMIYQMILMQLPLIFILIYLLINKLYETGNYYAFIVMIMMLPMAALRRKILSVQEPQELDPYLKQVGIITFAIATLLAIGLNYF